ncbi:ferrous iron transport protein A [Pontibacter ummariensis]|uniref:Ferrous iron transport protein A n=1 Tax=Pontibacter ummariensis TaxID=1610492 RepID=A0A239K9N5_9BACT|nr:ferrous iron transport protein A [Pontibacter ummariensis]SNT14329.1 ferrous iron transport protein A [Pontibacter ummariensis]
MQKKVSEQKSQKSVRDLKLGESGVICCLQDPEMGLKLLEMGCIPGTEVKLNSRAPLGDPITIIVNDYTLSLRLDEAETILLKQ